MAAALPAPHPSGLCAAVLYALAAGGAVLAVRETPKADEVLHALAGGVALEQRDPPKAGADLNKAKHDGSTPAMIAAEKGQTEALKVLVKANQPLHEWGRGCKDDGSGITICEYDPQFGSGHCATAEFRRICRSLEERGGDPVQAISHLAREPSGTERSSHTWFVPAPTVRREWETPGGANVKVISPGRLFVIDDFLSAPEVDRLLDFAKQRHAKPNFETAGRIPYCSFRKSASVWVRHGELQRQGLDIFEKIAPLTRTRPELLSHASVSKYDEGGFYSAHMDEEWCEEQIDEQELRKELAETSIGRTKPASRCSEKNHRRATTFLLYLSGAEEATGATAFPRLDHKVRPKKGRAIIFHPTTTEGLTDPLMLHAAETAGKGGKHVMQVWVNHGGHSQ